MSLPVILGRDFLDLFNIKLVNITPDRIDKRESYVRPYADEIINFVSVLNTNAAIVEVGNGGEPKRVSNPCADIPDVFCIDIAPDRDCVDIDPRLLKNCRLELKQIIDDAYLNTDIKIEPYKYEMKIHLTTDVPFHCPPRRLSYLERSKAQSIIDELQKENIIRPSNSPYASAIVLVRKKNGKGHM